MGQVIICEISLGELVDKLSILKIKSIKISDPGKLAHINLEEKLLSEKLNSLKLDGINLHLDEMIEINTKLWEVEDAIRDLEEKKQFDGHFIELARSVYKLNDERFRRKSKINQKYFSSIVEEKSYKEY